jgi:isochorismate pyruvate lyase
MDIVTEESSAVGIRRRLAENDEELVKVLARRERLLRAAAAADPAGQPEDADELAGRARNLALVHGLNPQVAERIWRAMLAGFAGVHRGEFAGS